MTEQNHSGIGHNYSDCNFQELQKYPTIIADVVNELGATIINNVEEKGGSTTPFNIEEKIKFNEVVSHKEVFEEHRVFYGRLNPIYKALDEEGSNKKDCLLRNIRTLYLQSKGKHIAANKGMSPDSVVKANSDRIILDVYNALLEHIEKSNNIKQPLEVIKTGLWVVVVDAFMRCKILEEPK